MPISAAERRFVMDQLGKRSQDDMIRLWDAAGRFEDVDFFNYISDAFPDIVIPYHQLAAEFSAAVFEEDFPDLAVTAVLADPPSDETLKKSAEWALGADGRKALDRMAGTIQRHIYDGDRDTTITNAEILGMRYVRVARPNACAFCRLLASRTSLSDDLYRSEEAALSVVGRSVNLSLGDRRAIASGQMTRDEALFRRDQMQLTYQIGERRGTPRGRRTRGSQNLGDKYHDFCKCTARAIPVGRDPLDVLAQEEPEFAILAEQWNNEYQKAREASASGDPKAILSAWRQLDAEIT